MPRKRSEQSRKPVVEKGGATTVVPSGPEAAAVPSTEDRRRMIAEAAYYRAERRGFAVGGELDDWVQSEAEIDRLLMSGGSQSRHSPAAM